MKTKSFLTLLTMGMSMAGLAQENDDMYFTSKDRVQVNAANEMSLARKYQQEDLNAVRSNPVNPSDSYSGRGINPEYGAQSKKGMTVVQNNPDYFLPTYQPKNVNQSLYNGSASSYSNPCGCNNSYSNPYNSGMGYGGFGSPYSSFNSPYNSFYSPYSSFYPRLGTSIGYGFGGYNPGFYGGMNYGMGSMYGMGGMYGMNSLYNSYGYGYPGNVVVIQGADVPHSTYGLHPSRSSNLNNYVDNSRSVSPTSGMVGTNGRVNAGGRVSGNSQPNYYDPSWRSNASNFPTRNSYDNNSGNSRSGFYSNGSSGTWDTGSRTRSSFDNMGSGSRGGFSGSGFSGGGFSGGGASGGGGTGGSHSRGRN